MQATKRVKDPRKQRKQLYNAPAHLRHKLMAAPLAPELISSKGAKSLPVRKGDTVRIVRGDHTGFEGKVSRVDLKRYRIFLEGLTREKVDGTNIFLSVHPSKVMIKNLKLDDKWRKAVVEIKKEQEPPKKEEKTVKVVEKEAEKPAEKPPKKPAKKTKAAKAKKEKPVEKKAAVKEKPEEKAPAAAKKRAPRKAAAKKEKEEKPAEKEKKPKTAKPAAAKKPRAKRKAASKTEGGT
jgi:large subunit ribosomal protein L24